ncbi:MAG: c-type cytochrome [Deltaproteobacteria bacterium]|nr:c-type cytochrome [Deltaproteobacteria bacterium]
MDFIEKFSGVFLIAGLFLFFMAFIGLAVVPVWMVDKVEPRQEIATSVPKLYLDTYSDVETYKAALRKGRDIYIAEACWHCHSQYVRPTANEELRYGPVSMPGEYQNELNLPQLFGTRRVGPDLSRAAYKKSNDWHYAHLYNPTSVVPQSVMPSYPWYFEVKDGVPQPKEEAKALVAYLQWLGSSVVEKSESFASYIDNPLPPKE